MMVRRIKTRFRAIIFNIFGHGNLRVCGKDLKISGLDSIVLSKNIRIGDYCWIDAIKEYASKKFTPKLIIGDDVAMSDFVHISSVCNISIGSGTLIGSRTYIGDHSHGSTFNFDLSLPPGMRQLADIDPIFIGKNCWICDGAVILAGTYLHDGTIVGANSVVKFKTDGPCLIAGSPAKLIRSF